MGNKDLDACVEVCPLCEQSLPRHSRGKTFHAAQHGISPKELAVLIRKENKPTCGCGCGGEVRWIGWSEGFAEYIRGHMSKDIRAAGTEKLKKSLEKHHWARGLNKNDSVVIRESSEKISKSLKRGFFAGEITHWSRGKTAKSDSRIARAAEKRSSSIKGKNHWRFMSNDIIIEKINSSLGDRFEVLSGLDALNDRESNIKHLLQVVCLRCKVIQDFSIYNVVRHETKKCRNCDRNDSSGQQEIRDFIESLGVEKILSSDRTNPTGYELDIYVPHVAFAVEFNGLYWHSSAINTNPAYHNNKTVSCRNVGINLIHVFEDEWSEKKNIVKSMIKNKLGLSTKIGARACQIVEMTKTESQKFFKENHIDGDSTGFITYSLVKDGKSFCAIKLRKPYSKKWKGCIEIARFATLLDHNVVGGYSKLLAHVKRKHTEKIFTYVDTRLGGEGKHCEISGMKLSHVAEKSFWWTDKERRYNRLYCKATMETSEKEEALKRGLFKIWGCSNLVYVS